ncbi:MAG: hypothetical protein K5648_05095 [Erysipelotrichaceae bacterium]|nr:hypothetical protein [Erysipelotrichaceae bacterium]
MTQKRSLEMKMVEAVFCILYLLFVFIATLIFFKRGQYLRCLLAGVLAIGDSFHLFPRIKIDLKGEGKNDAHRLQLGNIISSLTVTLFYVILFLVMKQNNEEIEVPSFFFHALLVLAAIRIYMLGMPQNDWFKRNKTETKWYIYRNIPFCLMGLLTIIYLIRYYKTFLMAVLVFLSFACYMGTVILARKNPKMGMLMIPKTICYVWIIAMFL